MNGIIYKSVLVISAIFLFLVNTYAQSGPSIKVIVNVPGVKVYINDKYKGIAGQGRPLICHDIGTGVANVKIEAGHHRDLRLVKVDSDREYQVDFEVPKSQTQEMLEKADAYFQKQQFITPKNENAFDIYHDILWTEPGNLRARGKILEMMGIFKTRGDHAYNNRKYKDVKKHYKQYLVVAEYVAEKFHYQHTQLEIQKVKNRLNKLRQKPSSGYLRVSVNVPGVEVYINEEYKGTAHLNRPLKYKAPISYKLIRVKVRKQGYRCELCQKIAQVKNRLSEVDFVLYRHEQKDAISEDAILQEWNVKYTHLGHTLMQDREELLKLEQMEQEGYDVEISKQVIRGNVTELLKELLAHLKRCPVQHPEIQKKIENFQEALKEWEAG